MEKKREPESIFPTKNKKQRRNTNKIHRRSTIKEDSKKSANESTRKERIKDYMIPTDDST